MGLGWVADDITEDERWAIAPLVSLAETDVAFAETVIGLSWVVDDISTHETAALSSLDVLADHDVDFARTIAGLPRVVDGISQTESWALGSLDGIVASNNLAFAELIKEPWFADGLDDEDVALLATLSTIRDSSAKLYDDLVRSRHARSTSISLPVAGEVRLWAFQPAPFPAGEDTLQVLEDAVRSAEAFMVAPFPVTDVILVVPSETEHEFVPGGLSYSRSSAVTFFTVTRYETDELVPWLVYHEVGHYYFYPDVGPPWLIEGGANFTAAYTRDRIGLEDLRDRIPTVREVVETECFADGIADIQELNDRLPVDSDVFGCNYSMGELFLLSVAETLGERATSAALRELYLTSRSELRPVTEAEIYRAFLKHTPPGREGEFLALYEELHGGSYDDEDS